MSAYYNGRRSVDRHAKCQNGFECRGPGCRVITGKTARKQNFARSHPNKRNVQPEVAKVQKPRGSR